MLLKSYCTFCSKLLDETQPEDNPFKVAGEDRGLRREVGRLRRENEMLLKASAFLTGRRL